MGGEQAANVLIQVKIDQYKYKGEEMPQEEIDKMKSTIMAKYAKEVYGAVPCNTAFQQWTDSNV